jgi:enoyl-CoA hydratase/carnithine racemase
MASELIDAFKTCGEDSKVHSIILRSSGRAFCGGGDIGYLYSCIKSGEGIPKDSMALASKLAITMRKTPKPIIAAVNGAAVGGGFMLVLTSDYVVAAEDVKFTAGFANIGLTPDLGGLYVMTRAMGSSKALELVFSGRIVRAEEAKQLGFVAEIAPLEDLGTQAETVAKGFASGPAMVYKGIKELFWTSECCGFEEYAKEEISLQMQCVDSKDFIDRVIAFVEKK